jgi:hypothetical protein
MPKIEWISILGISDFKFHNNSVLRQLFQK